MAKQTFTSGQTLTAAQMTTLQQNDYNMTVTTGTANYTLVASDVGQRRVQNMGSAGTVTVPNATFSAGDALWIHSIGSGTQSIVAGAGLTLNSSAGSAPTLAQWEGGVVYFTSSSSAIFFRGGGTTYGVATGGSSSSITVGGQAYTLLTFTSTGTLTVSKAGLFDVLLFGGGGAGAAGVAGGYAAGAGGAGGRILVTGLSLEATTYTLTVGGGGTNNTDGSIGNASRLGSLIYAYGGGSGGRPGVSVNGANGGGGGGGTWGATAGANPLVTDFGFAGGTGGTDGGGGGGVTAAGSGSTGGAGYDVSLFIGGSTSTKGTGGSGSATTGADGAANSADGGGGGKNANLGGTGGSGIIYVRFKV